MIFNLIIVENFGEMVLRVRAGNAALLEKWLKSPVAGAFGTGFLNRYLESGTKSSSFGTG